MIASSNLLATGRMVLLLAGGCLLTGSMARAQDGYKVSEKPAAPAETPAPKAGDPPPAEAQRLARFEYVSGKVTWRPDDNADWKKATENLPLREGAQIWAVDGGRAEIRFNDGSILRLGSGGLVTLKTFYSDDQGEYTQIKMLAGLATLRPRQDRSLFEVNTPTVSVKASGPARVRIGVTDSVEVGVRQGRATVEGTQGKTTLTAGEYMSLRDASSPMNHLTLPAEDSWERWNDEREHKIAAESYPHPRPVYGPSVWLSLDFPLYPSYRYHGGYFERGRGAHRRW